MATSCMPTGDGNAPPGTRSGNNVRNSRAAINERAAEVGFCAMAPLARSSPSKARSAHIIFFVNCASVTKHCVITPAPEGTAPSSMPAMGRMRPLLLASASTQPESWRQNFSHALCAITVARANQRGSWVACANASKPAVKQA